MRIAVCVKQVVTREWQVRIDEAGTWVRDSDASWELNEPDAYALEESLRLREKHSGEVVVVSAGPARVTQVLREALARGADRAIHVQGAIGTARQRLAQHLRDASRAGRDGNHFASLRLAQPQCRLERIGVGLVHFVADVLLADPGLVVAQAWLPFARRDLLDADGDFHVVSTTKDTTAAKITSDKRCS